VTNLTKNNAKHKQVSFFGVYDGYNGTARADYMRDNYHLMLIQDEAFPINMETALRRTLHRLNVGFSEDPRFNGDSSAVSFAIIIVLSKDGVTQVKVFTICRRRVARQFSRRTWAKTFSFPLAAILLSLNANRPKKRGALLN